MCVATTINPVELTMKIYHHTQVCLYSSLIYQSIKYIDLKFAWPVGTHWGLKSSRHWTSALPPSSNYFKSVSLNTNEDTGSGSWLLWFLLFVLGQGFLESLSSCPSAPSFLYSQYTFSVGGLSSSFWKLLCLYEVKMGSSWENTSLWRSSCVSLVLFLFFFHYYNIITAVSLLCKWKTLL